MKTIILGGIVLALTILIVACGGGDSETDTAIPTHAAGTQVSGIDPADFSARIDNPLFPLTGASRLVYEGEETDADTGETFTTRVEMTVLPQTDIVAGVEVTVVQDQAFEDGELVESTLDNYAQHKDGSVYYFGERVNNYEDGEVKNHDGSWLAGEGQAKPGTIMPAAPAVGAEFEQEKAPGIAEDRMTVLSVSETVTVPAGTFEGCIKTEDVNPLDPANAIEYKYYCPNVGFILEEFDGGSLKLVSYE